MEGKESTDGLGVAVEVLLDVPANAVVLDAASARNAELLHGFAMRTQIEEQASFDGADRLLADIGAALKGLDAQRLESTKPLRRATDAINAVAKRIREPLEQARDALRGKLLSYQDAKRLEAQRERDRVALLAELERAEEPDEPKALKVDSGPMAISELLPQVTPSEAPSEYIVPQSKAVTRRKVQTLRVVDRKEIPREVGGVALWILDEKTVLRLLKAKVKVPGCELEEDSLPVGRGGG